MASFLAFMFFNCIFGLSGIALIGGAIYLLIETKFNTLNFSIIIAGVIICLIFFLGVKTRKQSKVLIMYLILIFIIFIFYAVLFCLFIFAPDKILEVLKSKMNDLDGNDMTSIENHLKKHTTALYAITGTGAGCCLLSLITGLIYYCKLNKGKQDDLDVEKVIKDDCLHGIDYSIFPE